MAIVQGRCTSGSCLHCPCLCVVVMVTLLCLPVQCKRETAEKKGFTEVALHKALWKWRS